MKTPAATSVPPAGRPAFTLLEVLVALGILVVGLASVAALLPASGSVLAEAGLADRSGVLAANAQADLRNRRMLTADQFQAAGVRAVVLGDVFPASPFEASPFARHTRSGEVRFALGDELELASGNVPVARDGGVCYGATIAPSTSATPVLPGNPAVVSVAVFRKAGVETKTLSLTATGSGSGVFQVAQEPDRKRFLPGCSWVLARSGGDQQPPRWLQVGSSWATMAPGGTVPTGSFVAFVDADAAATLLGGGAALTVHAFDGLLRVDERPAVLE